MKDKEEIFIGDKPVVYAGKVDLGTEADKLTSSPNKLNDTITIEARTSELRKLFEESPFQRQVREKFDELKQMFSAMMLIGITTEADMVSAIGGKGLETSLKYAFENPDTGFRESFTSLCIALIHTNDKFRSIITQVINDEKVIHL